MNAQPFSVLGTLRQAPKRLVERLLSGPPVEFKDRSQKARTIEGIVRQGLGQSVVGLDILDIGCGNGDISRHFAINNRVHGVDVKDRRAGREEPFEFSLIESEKLSFADACFDVILSHHVIEHVSDQVLHLQEIRRTLRPTGLAYVATPNKSSPIMRGHVGNDQVLRYEAMVPLFESQGFDVTEHSTSVFVEPDRYNYPMKLGQFIPYSVAHRLRSYYPSHMFTLRPKP